MTDYLTRRMERLSNYVDWAQEHQQETVCNDVVPALAEALEAAQTVAQEWLTQARHNEAEAVNGEYDAATRGMLNAAAYDLRTRAEAVLDALAGPLRSERLDRLVGATQ